MEAQVLYESTRQPKPRSKSQPSETGARSKSVQRRIAAQTQEEVDGATLAARMKDEELVAHIRDDCKFHECLVTRELVQRFEALKELYEEYSEI